jgi:hypothetical protein
MKIHQPNLIGECVGDDNFQDGVVSRVTMTADDIDWSLGNSFKRPTITGAITITDSNLPQGSDTKCISLEVDGDFAIIFPAYWVWKGGKYDGLLMNRVIIDCINGNSGTEEVYYQIIPNA